MNKVKYVDNVILDKELFTAADLPKEQRPIN